MRGNKETPLALYRQQEYELSTQHALDSCRHYKLPDNTTIHVKLGAFLTPAIDKHLSADMGLYILKNRVYKNPLLLSKFDSLSRRLGLFTNKSLLKGAMDLKVQNLELIQNNPYTQGKLDVYRAFSSEFAGQH